MRLCLNNTMITLKQFVEESLTNYTARSKEIPLFQEETQKSLTNYQQKQFVKVFYNVRGHFYKYLWYLGSLTDNNQIKSLVCKNIKEEFGTTVSHDTLYFEFGEQYGLDRYTEIVEESNYLPFVREFDKGHLKVLLSQTDNYAWAAFSAYEALDNIDYQLTKDLVQNFSLKPKSVEFFETHVHVTHFQDTSPQLTAIWETDPQSVRDGFEFILDHQLTMWNKFWEYLAALK